MQSPYRAPLHGSRGQKCGKVPRRTPRSLVPEHANATYEQRHMRLTLERGILPRCSTLSRRRGGSIPGRGEISDKADTRRHRADEYLFSVSMR